MKLAILSNLSFMLLVVAIILKFILKLRFPTDIATYVANASRLLYTQLLFGFCDYRGANPNAKTLPTDYLRNRSNMRREEREKSIRENRTRIISLEKSKALKRIRELKEKEERESDGKRKVQGESKKMTDQRIDLSLNLNNQSDGLNPFNDSYQDSNPFLNSPTDSDYSFVTQGDTLQIQCLFITIISLYY